MLSHSVGTQGASPDIDLKIRLFEASLSTYLCGIARKDQTSMQGLYNATASRLCSIACKWLAAKEDAEEVLGDVYWHVWTHHDAYSPARGPVMGWLAVMTRSRSIDRYRKNCGDNPDEHQRLQLVGCLASAEALPETSLRSLQRANAAHAAVAKLPPVSQKLVELSFFMGLSHYEIADATHLPLGTVKSHLRRAVLRLRTILSADPAERAT